MPLFVHQCNYIMNVCVCTVTWFCSLLEIKTWRWLACGQRAHTHVCKTTKSFLDFLRLFGYAFLSIEIKDLLPCNHEIVFCSQVSLIKCPSAKSSAKVSDLNSWKIKDCQKFHGDDLLIMKNNDCLLLLRNVLVREFAKWFEWFVHSIRFLIIYSLANFNDTSKFSFFKFQFPTSIIPHFKIEWLWCCCNQWLSDFECDFCAA